MPNYEIEFEMEIGAKADAYGRVYIIAKDDEKAEEEAIKYLKKYLTKVRFSINDVKEE